jgi:calcineurin-like phosphoesterase family protein
MEYCDRPFDKVSKMNHTILSNYKRLVEPNDLVYFLGDLSMRGPDNINWYKSTFQKLPGRKHLILGNHDHLSVWQYEDAGFMTIHSALHLELLDLYLVHDPAKSLVVKHKPWICGHVHNLFPRIMRPNLINVSVDVWNFEPAPLDKILELLDISVGGQGGGIHMHQVQENME